MTSSPEYRREGLEYERPEQTTRHSAPASRHAPTRSASSCAVAASSGKAYWLTKANRIALNLPSFRGGFPVDEGQGLPDVLQQHHLEALQVDAELPPDCRHDLQVSKRIPSWDLPCPHFIFQFRVREPQIGRDHVRQERPRRDDQLSYRLLSQDASAAILHPHGGIQVRLHLASRPPSLPSQGDASWSEGSRPTPLRECSRSARSH